MKLIHTADCHLDSKLSRHFDEAKAAERKNELLSTFQNIVHYAVSNDVEAILIAGDLFDVRTISATARDAVISAVLNNPGITFFYLRGNHDAGAFLQNFRDRIHADLPGNLKLFEENWTSYPFVSKDGTEVIITGAEDPVSNYSKYTLDLEKRYKAIGLSDVSIKIYPGMRHEILNEDGRQEVYNDILEFFNK